MTSPLPPSFHRRELAHRAVPLALLLAGCVGRGSIVEPNDPGSRAPATGTTVGGAAATGGTSGARATGGTSGTPPTGGISGAPPGPGVDHMLSKPVPGASRPVTMSTFKPGPRAPVFTTAATPARPVLPLGGHTLAVLRDGTAVASDPDRDRVWLANLADGTVKDVALPAGDQPGRFVEDGSGRVHVVLRGAGAIVSIDPAAAALGERRPVCPAPRGIGVHGTDLVVACAGGEVVFLPVAGGPARLTVNLEPDLRDVLSLGGKLAVSSFRSAELVVLDDSGAVLQRRRPPVAVNLTRRAQAAFEGAATTRFVPNVAWRALAAPDGGAFMLHQRAYTGEVDASAAATGGYGGLPCGGIIQSVVTQIPAAGTTKIRPSPEIAGAFLAVDLAVSPDGGTLAVISPTLAQTAANTSLLAVGPAAAFRVDAFSGCVPESGGFTGPVATAPTETPFDSARPKEFLALNHLKGEAVAVAFDGAGDVVLLVREPPALLVPGRGLRIPLPGESRVDTGHAIFHADTGLSVACAACHPEGGDDAHVWRFVGLGPRRTQSLRGGVAETLPLHWDGDMRDIGHIADDVYTARMGGPMLTPEHKARLAAWIEALPFLPAAPPADAAAVARGQALFARADVACASCHKGPRYTTNQTVDVGTGRRLQVPSLRGLKFRAPYMHDGCAPNLAARFDTSCGGASHGNLAGLGAAELADLKTFLESL